MTGLEALQSVQYVAHEGKRFAVIDLDDWEALIEWLEELEDSQVVQHALAQLKSAAGDPETAGWLRGDEIRDDL